MSSQQYKIRHPLSNPEQVQDSSYLHVQGSYLDSQMNNGEKNKKNKNNRMNKSKNNIQHTQQEHVEEHNI